MAYTNTAPSLHRSSAALRARAAAAIVDLFPESLAAPRRRGREAAAQGAPAKAMPVSVRWYALCAKANHQSRQAATEAQRVGRRFDLLEAL